MTDALKEALKEGLRVILIAVLPLIIYQAENGSIEWRSLLLVGGITGLRFIDKLLHETGKDSGDAKLMKGLTGF